MQEQKDLKYKIGMGFIFLGIFSPLISFAVPLLDLSTGTTTALVTFFMVGAPEIFLIAGAALAGKQAFESIKKELFPVRRKDTISIRFNSFCCHYSCKLGVCLPQSA